MDLNYLYFRQQVERDLADKADNAQARRAHDGLARGYEEEIARVTGNLTLLVRRESIPCPLSLVLPWAPTMTWSCTVIFMCRPASIRSRVRRMSRALGDGSPEG